MIDIYSSPSHSDWHALGSLKLHSDHIHVEYKRGLWYPLDDKGYLPAHDVGVEHTGRPYHAIRASGSADPCCSGQM